MLAAITSILTLLLGISVLVTGYGFLGTLLGIRASVEQFGPVAIGVIMSAYFLGFVLGSYVCPGLIQRFGHIRAYAAMAAVASVCVLLHGMWVDPMVWALLRVATGVCMVGLYMVIESWLNAQTPRQRRGRVFAVYMAITLLAVGVGQYLILVTDVHTLEAFALAAILFSLGLVPVALTRVAEPLPIESPHLGLRHLYRVSHLGVAGAAASGLANGAFFGVGAVFAYRIGLPEAGIAGFMSATVFGGVLLQWPVGHRSDRHDRRTVLVVVAFLAAGAALLALLAVRILPPALFLFAFVYGGLALSVYPLSVAHMNDHLESGAVLEATKGLLLLYGLGAALGPVLVGVLMEVVGPGSLLGFMALVQLLLGIFGVARMRYAPPVPIEEQAEFVAMTRTSPVALEMDPRADLEQAARE